MIKKFFEKSNNDLKEKNIKNNIIFNSTKALEEAKRCLSCKNAPCYKKCPFNINIPAFILKIKDNKINDAYKVISEHSFFPAICSRVCYAKNQCEGGCIKGIKDRPVSISALERYVTKNASTEFRFDNSPKLNLKKIAVVGSGPAGMSSAAFLKKAGYNVTIFEKMPKSGGMLFYGIPESRLSKLVLQKEINKLKKIGIEIKNNIIVGETVLLKDLLNSYGYSAVFLSMGTWTPKKAKIQNKNLKRAYSFTDFLTLINRGNNSQKLDDLNSVKNVAVIGGGNVAIDVARTAKKLQNIENVYLIYRRSENELLANESEIQLALKENIIFKMLTNTKKIIDDHENAVKEIVCTKNELLKNTDTDGRRIFSEILNSEFKIKVEAVVFCTGSSASIISDKDPYKKDLYDSENKLKINKNYQSKVFPQIFAGGDLVLGSSTVAKAMANGIKVAENIHKYLSDLL